MDEYFLCNVAMSAEHHLPTAKVADQAKRSLTTGAFLQLASFFDSQVPPARERLDRLDAAEVGAGENQVDLLAPQSIRDLFRLTVSRFAQWPEPVITLPVRPFPGVRVPDEKRRQAGRL
jgi:hypothetical protein